MKYQSVIDASRTCLKVKLGRSNLGAPISEMLSVRLEKGKRSLEEWSRVKGRSSGLLESLVGFFEVRLFSFGCVSGRVRDFGGQVTKGAWGMSWR